jgi:hypothetical protein
MSNEIIPFGKYKGQPVDVLMNDRPYLEWLQGQDWFRARYQNINTLIINNFREPAETPEHNKIQAMFLDGKFLYRFVEHLKSKYASRFYYERRESDLDPWEQHQYNDEDWNKLMESKIIFEENGIDVSWGNYLNIEIKPVLSHDYPAVLRQMKTQGCNILFIGVFEAEGLTIEQVRKIFYPILIITMNDVN